MSSNQTITMEIPSEIAGEIQRLMEMFQNHSIAQGAPAEAAPVEFNMELDQHEPEEESVQVEVRRILKSQRRNGVMEYRLSFTDGTTEWVEEDKCDCDWLISQFLKGRVKTYHCICRVSTEEQAQDSKTSLNSQESALRSYVTQVGGKDVRVNVIRIAKSAYKSIPKRIMELVETANPGDEIVTFRIDRLSRNIEQSIEWLNKMAQKNVEVVALLDEAATLDGEDSFNPIYYSKSRLRFLEGLLNAEKEAKLLSNKMKRAIQERKNRGDEAIGGLPYGTEYQREDGRLVVREDKVAMEIIEKVRSEVKKCTTGGKNRFSRVANNLNSKGITKKRGKSMKKGMKWTAGMVASIYF